MTVVEPVARVRVGGGAAAGRLVCHPRLPLVAGLESARPAVHIWDCDAGRLHALATIGAESTAYGDVRPRNREQPAPAVAWHPDQPLLVVSDGNGLARWTPDGLSEVEEAPPTAAYRGMTFTPDGQTLWATPSSSPELEAWQDASDTLDLDSGAVFTGPAWNTGIAVHPGGGLVAALHGDDFEGTTVLFARVDEETVPATMRILSLALELDVDNYDNYETPIFSTDGRHLAIRSHTENSLEVFGFPSLRRVLKTEWRVRMDAWSRHNIAFGTQPDVLWVGTPAGILEERDLRERRTVEHDVLDGHAVTALASTPAGELVVAHSGGELVLLSVLADPANARILDADAVRATVTTFLDAVPEVPDEDHLWEHLVLTDGIHTENPQGGIGFL